MLLLYSFNENYKKKNWLCIAFKNPLTSFLLKKKSLLKPLLQQQRHCLTIMKFIQRQGRCLYNAFVHRPLLELSLDYGLISVLYNTYKLSQSNMLHIHRTITWYSMEGKIIHQYH